MKGIILAAGTGSRLFPITHSASKSLLPVYNKPMIYYPLSILMLAGIREILIISSEEFLTTFKNLLGDGSDLGISIQYEIQEKPAGIAQSFHIGKSFIGDDNVCLILGDNFFYGHRLPEILINAKNKVEKNGGGIIFGFNVCNPEKYGVVELDNDKIVSIVEKPKNPKSNWAVVGLYMYDNSVIKISESVKPSERGELEITSVNQKYLKNKKLSITTMGRGYTWFDTGNAEDLFLASSFVRMIENRQGLKIACIEEIAYYMGYINMDQLSSRANELRKTEYGEYLKMLVERRDTFIYEQN